MKKLFIITGELSGDVHAANVVKHLKAVDDNEIEIRAIGGENLEEQDVKLFSNHSKAKMGVVGLTPKILFDHITLGVRLVDYLKNEYKPDLVLLIDYGGFNLNISRALKKEGFKVFYFIPPQIWASRKWRLNTIKKYIDKVLTIFPFEAEMYKQKDIDYEFVGHPLTCALPPKADKKDFFKRHGLDESKRLVSIFPGSREFELQYLMGTFLESKVIIEQQCKDVQFVISKAKSLSDKVFYKHFKNTKDLKVIEGENHALLSVSDALILASGTVALEAALYQTPMIISYKGPTLFYWIYKLVRSIDKASLPNIISQKDIIKEFLQKDSKPNLIADEIIKILENKEYSNTMIEELLGVQSLLSDGNATENVARIIKAELCN